MASSPFILLAAITAILFLHVASTPQNLTEILVKGGNFPIFVRVLGELNIDQQIQNQLNYSNNGFTIFAPTDNAFNKLPFGTWNNLNPQQKAAFINYHVVPTYYNFTSIGAATNPIRTEGSNNGTQYTVNITANSNPLTDQFNVSTGVNTVMVTYALNTTYPLEVFIVDSMLLPPDLFPPSLPASPPPSPLVTNTTSPPSGGGAFNNGGGNSTNNTAEPTERRAPPPLRFLINGGFRLTVGWWIKLASFIIGFSII